MSVLDSVIFPGCNVLAVCLFRERLIYPILYLLIIIISLPIVTSYRPPQRYIYKQLLLHSGYRRRRRAVLRKRILRRVLIESATLAGVTLSENDLPPVEAQGISEDNQESCSVGNGSYNGQFSATMRYYLYPEVATPFHFYCSSLILDAPHFGFVANGLISVWILYIWGMWVCSGLKWMARQILETIGWLLNWMYRGLKWMCWGLIQPVMWTTVDKASQHDN